MYEIDMAFQGPDFMLALHTASILVVIVTCFMYAGGIPLLNFFCFFSLFFLYWIDKYLVMNHYRTPPRYTQIFNDRILTILPWAVILHSAFSMYMYGNEHIFPTAFHTETDEFGETYVEADRETLDHRMGRDSGVPFIILMLVGGFLIIFN